MVKAVKNVIVLAIYFLGLSHDDLVQEGFLSFGTSVFQCDYMIYGRASIC